MNSRGREKKRKAEAKMVWEHFFQQSGKNTSDIFSVLISHSFPLLQRCFDNCVLTQIQIQNLLTAFSFPSNLQPKMKSAFSPYYFSSQIKMFNRQSLLTQVCPRKVSVSFPIHTSGKDIISQSSWLD